MACDVSDKQLSELAWKHIAAEEYDKAEVAIRQRIAIADPKDSRLLWELYGLLASTLNSLAQHAEATAILRESLGYEWITSSQRRLVAQLRLQRTKPRCARLRR